MAAIKIASGFLLAVWVLEFTKAFDDEELIWKCGREEGIDADIIAALNRSKGELIETEDEKIKCYFKCIFQETKWMSPEGKLQVGIYDDENDKEAFEHIVTECMSVKGDYPCQTAYLFQVCVYQKKEEEEEQEEEQQEQEGQQDQGQQEQGEQNQGQQEQEQQSQGQEEQEQQEQGQEQGQQEKQPEEN